MFFVQRVTKKVSSVLVESFFHHPGSANMAKCGKTTIGSFKKKGRGNDTKLRHDVSREVQK